MESINNRVPNIHLQIHYIFPCIFLPEFTRYSWFSREGEDLIKSKTMLFEYVHRERQLRNMQRITFLLLHMWSEPNIGLRSIRQYKQPQRVLKTQWVAFDIPLRITQRILAYKDL